MKNYLIALDGGATRYRIALIDLDSETIVKEEVENTPLNFTFTKNFIKTFIEAVSKIYNPQSTVLVAGLSGIDTDEEKVKATKIIKIVSNRYFKNISQIHVLNDIELILNFSNSQNKIALCAGTGSNCLGLHNGNLAKSGGAGLILSDQGSGYYIGSEALKLAQKSQDGRGTKTELETRITKYFRLENFSEMKKIFDETKIDKSKIAEIAKIVAISAQNNDKVAISILEKCVVELLKHLQAVHKKLNLLDNPFDLILIGGVFTIPIVSEGILNNVVKYNINKIINIKNKSYLAGLHYYKLRIKNI